MKPIIGKASKLRSVILEFEERNKGVGVFHFDHSLLYLSQVEEYGTRSITFKDEIRLLINGEFRIMSPA